MSDFELMDDEPDDDDPAAPCDSRPNEALVPHLRCFVDHAIQEDEPQKDKGQQDEPEDCVLVFDTETTVDIHQRLRIVAWRLIRRRKRETRAWGIAYNADTLAVSPDPETQQQETSEAIALIERYCEEQGGIAETLQEWIEKRFFRYGFQWRHTVVGFNLFFDLTRLAQEATPAIRSAFGKTRGKQWKAGTRPKANFYHDGFSMVFHNKPFMPGLKAKKLGRHKFSYRWAANGRKKPWTGRGGPFIDAQTVGLALRKPRASLAAMCDAYRDNMPWLPRDYVFKDFQVEHGKPITREYLDYATGDVRDTAHLFFAVCAEYAKHQLETPIDKIFSEASLGKAYYRQLGIKPFLEAHAAFPKEYIGYGMQAFYGGRCDVRYRCKAVEVAYCDFTSQYPTINALLRLQDYHTAATMRPRHGIGVMREVAALLQEIKQSDFAVLLDRNLWRRLRYFVKIKPARDILPLRTNFGDQVATNVGLARQSAEDSHEGSWFTVQHLIGSMLLLACSEYDEDEEKPPALHDRLLDAFVIEPGNDRVETQAIRLFGEVPIDLNQVDLFTTVIEQRSRTKAKMKHCERGSPEEARLKSVEQGLKLLTNATSYGILVEVNESEFSKPIDAILYADKTTRIRTTVIDEAGRNFMGPLGALITSSGWLLLAMADHWADRLGLRIAACDTDGFMVAKPDDMAREDFACRVDRLTETFDALNPYDATLIPHLVKIEDENFDRDGKRKPLYGYFVSSKRYALFNIEEMEGRRVPVIRKASLHGTGNLRVPDEALRQLRIDASALRGGLNITPSHLRSLREAGRSQADQLTLLRYGEEGSHPADTFSEIHAGYQPMGWQELWWLINLYSLVKLLPPNHVAETRALDVPQIAQVTIATWTIYQQFGEKLKIAPGGFIATLPALYAPTYRAELIEFPDDPEANRTQCDELYKRLDGQGFYAPLRKTFDDLKGEVRSLADPTLRVALKRPVTIRESLERDPGYFSRPEYKAEISEGIGWLDRRTCPVSSPKFIGKETSRQADTAAESGQDIREDDARVLAIPPISIQQQRFIVDWLSAAEKADRDRVARVALTDVSEKASRLVLAAMKNNRLPSENEKWRLVYDTLVSEPGRAALASQYAKDVGLTETAEAAEKDGWPALLADVAADDIAAAAGVKVGLAKQWKAGSKRVPWRAHESLAALINKDGNQFRSARWQAMIADFVAGLPPDANAADEIAAIAGVTRLQASAIAKGGLPPSVEACLQLIEAFKRV